MLLRNIIGRTLREAALADGGDAGGAAPQQSQSQPAQGGDKRPVHERIKAYLADSEQGSQQRAGDADEVGEDGNEVAPKQHAKAPAREAANPQQQQAEGDQEAANADDFTSLSELAERTGLTVDRLMDLSVPGKVGDKETKASIREMLKSYQTAELLNSKQQTHASEVAAWKTQQQQEQAKYQQNLQRLDAGLQVMQRQLQGEFGAIDWATLQQGDPATFNQQYVAFQHRQAQLDHIAQQLGQERQTQQSAQAEKHKAWLAEQKSLLEAKLPEFADKAKRDSRVTEYANTVGKQFGFTADEINQLTDHRDFLVLDAAHQWLKLQAGKTQVMNKVRTAPPLLKPGTAQSSQARQEQSFNEAKNKARKSGNVRDAARALIASGVI